MHECYQGMDQVIVRIGKDGCPIHGKGPMALRIALGQE